MLMSLGVRILVHPTETHDPHAVRIVVLDADGHQLAESTFGFEPPSPELRAGFLPGEEWSLPVAVNLTGVMLPHEGSYSVEVLVDGHHQASVGFLAQPNPTGEPT